MNSESLEWIKSNIQLTGEYSTDCNMLMEKLRLTEYHVEESSRLVAISGRLNKKLIEEINQSIIDIKILESALKLMANNFEQFIKSCIDINGKSISPSNKDIMKARACLPKDMELALTKGKS